MSTLSELEAVMPRGMSIRPVARSAETWKARAMSGLGKRV